LDPIFDRYAHLFESPFKEMISGLDPIFDRYAHLFESPFKEMISGFDADQLLGVGEGVDQRFEFSWGTEVIARATNEKFRLRARTQEFEIIDAAFDGDGGQAEGDECADSVVGVGGTQSDGGAERKAGEDDRQRELAFEPVEGGAHVFNFSDAAGVFAFAQAGAAEVEAEHRESEAIERFHGMEDDFVVERSAVERMRMADHGGVRRVGGPGVEQSFQASGGAGEEKRADAGRFGWHGIRVQQWLDRS